MVDSALFVPVAIGSFTTVPGQLVGEALATLRTLAAVVSHGRLTGRRSLPRVSSSWALDSGMIHTPERS